MKQFLSILCLAGLIISCQTKNKENTSAEPTVETTAKKPEWISLFNGKDLDDWKIKISKHELGDNYANTFRVEDGLLKVRYDGYDKFDQQYGHMFYKKPFSAYLLRLEYRFTGEQAPEGEGWAWRNSGAMLHGQSPESMLKDQDFPISIEAQILGGNGSDPRPTGNLCTPGTNVVIADTLYTDHCLNSSSKTYHGDQWVRMDMLVLRDSVIHHIVEKDTVLTYYKPQFGAGSVSNFDPAVKKDGELIKEGYISLQSESHPIEFRKVHLLDLEPYMNDPKKLKEILEEVRD